jgi:Leucine-rich repeat (LRR) protein
MSEDLNCKCGCVPNIKSLFEMAELRARRKEATTKFRMLLENCTVSTNDRAVEINLDQCELYSHSFGFKPFSSTSELLISLSLNKNYLTTLPNDIFGYLRNLQVLSIQSNGLQFLPDTISNLINLRELYVDDNMLHRLPEELSRCTCLIILRIDNNPIAYLPESIGDLKQLERLSMRNVKIPSLPISLKDCKSLQIIAIDDITTKSQTVSQNLRSNIGIAVANDDNIFDHSKSVDV